MRLEDAALLLKGFQTLVNHALDLWSEQPAFIEILSLLREIISHVVACCHPNIKVITQMTELLY